MIYKYSIIFAVLFMIYVINKVRNKKLYEKYSILWIIFSIIIIILSVGYKLLDKLSIMIQIYYSPALLFLAGFIFLILYMVHLSTVVTKQNKSIIRLNQELSILEEKNRKKNKEGNE